MIKKAPLLNIDISNDRCCSKYKISQIIMSCLYRISLGIPREHDICFDGDNITSTMLKLELLITITCSHLVASDKK